jgi:hypothetical protein
MNANARLGSYTVIATNNYEYHIDDPDERERIRQALTQHIVPKFVSFKTVENMPVLLRTDEIISMIHSTVESRQKMAERQAMFQKREMELRQELLKPQSPLAH